MVFHFGVPWNCSIKNSSMDYPGKIKSILAVVHTPGEFSGSHSHIRPPYHYGRAGHSRKSPDPSLQQLDGGGILVSMWAHKAHVWYTFSNTLVEPKRTAKPHKMFHMHPIRVCDTPEVTGTSDYPSIPPSEDTSFGVPWNCSTKNSSMDYPVKINTLV